MQSYSGQEGETKMKSNRYFLSGFSLENQNFVNMMEENKEAKFTIEGNPGTGNTFINIGKAINVNPNATTVENKFYFGSDGEMKDAALREATGQQPDGKKLGAMTLREMLKKGLIDTGNIQKEILNYVSCIRPKLKAAYDKKYEALWAAIVEHEAFSVDLYDPRKQQCTFNRNLVANIIHYLDGKGFYEEPYSAAAMTRALEAGEDQHPIRRALGLDPEPKYCQAVDEILSSLDC